MDCLLTRTGGKTFACLRCGRTITLRTRRDPSQLHFRCKPGRVVQEIAPAPAPAREHAKPAKTESAVEVLLATIRTAAGPVPPWPAIERHARHVCETRMWAGCEQSRKAWAKRVVELAGKRELWPKDWGPYPEDGFRRMEPHCEVELLGVAPPRHCPRFDGLYWLDEPDAPGRWAFVFSEIDDLPCECYLHALILTVDDHGASVAVLHWEEQPDGRCVLKTLAAFHGTLNGDEREAKGLRLVPVGGAMGSCRLWTRTEG